MRPPIFRCTLSGSYRKDYDGLQSAYHELATNGCQILSPNRLDFNSNETLFVRDAAEEYLTEEFIERHHLLAISQSDFLWLHTPNGYIGSSTAFEIGYAVSHGIPVFSSVAPTEKVFESFIQVVPSVYSVINSLRVS
jgi:nucleoside 2-deoxyribosyltransferase